MELMASKTLSWTRKDNLLSNFFESFKMLTSKSLHWVPRPSRWSAGQAEQSTAAHMGSIQQARDPDSVLGALKVSCNVGEKKPWQGNKGKVQLAKVGEYVQKRACMPEKTRGKRERRRILFAGEAEGAVTSKRLFLRASTVCLGILFTVHWRRKASRRASPCAEARSELGILPQQQEQLSQKNWWAILPRRNKSSLLLGKYSSGPSGTSAGPSSVLTAASHPRGTLQDPRLIAGYHFPLTGPPERPQTLSTWLPAKSSDGGSPFSSQQKPRSSFYDTSPETRCTLSPTHIRRLSTIFFQDDSPFILSWKNREFNTKAGFCLSTNLKMSQSRMRIPPNFT